MPVEALLRDLWSHRGRMLLVALALIAAGFAVVIALPRHYVAQTTVAPAETTSIATSSLLSPSPLLSSGLLDTRPTGNFAVYLDALSAPEAAVMLAAETSLVSYLTTRRSRGPMGWVRRSLGMRTKADVDDVLAWLERNLSVTQGVATVTFTVALSHSDREVALDVLRRLHALAEAKVRADLAGMARRRITAIEMRLTTERDLFLRNALYELLGQQQRAALVVSADEAVAARMVSSPMVERRPSVPNRPVLLLLLLVVSPLAALSMEAAVVLGRWRLQMPLGAAAAE